MPAWRERLADFFAYASPVACVVALACVAFSQETGARIAVTVGAAGYFAWLLLGEINSD